MAEANVGEIRAALVVDLSSWTRGLQTAASQLQTFQAGLTGRLTPALQATSQALTQTGTAAGQMGTQMQAATRSTSALSQAMTIASGIGLATSVQGMVQAVVAFGRETVQTGARLEQLRASLSALAGSTTAGQAQFDSLFQSAQRLGVPFEALARGWRTLTAAASAAGIPLGDQRRLLEAVATEGRRTGASSEQLTRAFEALGQMASKGRLSLEELTGQLGEAIGTSLPAMARGLGVTTAELLKLAEAGGVAVPTAFRALTRGLEEAQRAGGQTGDTLQTAFNRFSNELVRSRDELMKMAGPLSTITKGATDFLKVLNDSAQAQRQLATAQAEESRLGTGLRAGDMARLPALQQRELTALNRQLAEQVLAQGDPNAPPMFQPSREEHIANLKARIAAIYDSARAIKAQGEEQIKATAEVNKARAAQELQADTLKDLTTQMDALAKAGEDFRKRAALAPEVYGRPGSEEFLRGRQQALRPGLEKLTESLTRVPAGVTIPAELEARGRTFGAEYGGITSALDALQAKQTAGRRAETETEQARQRAAREAEQAQETYQSAIDKTRLALAQQQDTAVQTLTRLEEAYTHTAAGQDRLTAAKLAAQFPENEEIQRRAALVTTLSKEAEANKEAFNAIQQRTDALREAADAEAEALQKGRERLEQTREELLGRPRESTRMRQQLARGVTSAEGWQEGQRLLAEQESLERLIQVAGIWREVAFGVGSAWSQALQSIADHTKTVGEAFRAMGQSILQTFADIAAQQATQALFGLGLRVLTSALTGGAGGGVALAGAGAGGGGAGLFAGMGGASAPVVPLMAEGGFISKPTLVLAGERGPEHIVPQAQMQALMSGMQSPQPGGAQNVSVILVDSRHAADQAALAERAKGHNVVVQEVVNDLSKGESSPILRTLRTLQR